MHINLFCVDKSVILPKDGLCAPCLQAHAECLSLGKDTHYRKSNSSAAFLSWPDCLCVAADIAGFIRIDECLRAEGLENVFAVGDVASSIKHPRPKAGVYAVRQGPPLADNLRRRVPSLTAAHHAYDRMSHSTIDIVEIKRLCSYWACKQLCGGFECCKFCLSTGLSSTLQKASELVRADALHYADHPRHSSCKDALQAADRREAAAVCAPAHPSGPHHNWGQICCGHQGMALL